MHIRRASCLLLLWSLCGFPEAVTAGTVRVAVASNFVPTLADLAPEFETLSGHRLSPSAASTGKHYAQILAGAPFDVLLAADAERPRRLVGAGRALSGTRFAYALGRLALWRPAGVSGDDWKQTLLDYLERPDNRRLAMANPRLAPYGAAARQALLDAGFWNSLSDRLVLGENVAQVYLFIDSGNAELGFVAASQLLSRQASGTGSYALLPSESHPPIEQQAVQLRELAEAEEFLAFLRSETAREIIARHGYGLP
jgi:molybdate transport system substrate-binding protein